MKIGFFEIQDFGEDFLKNRFINHDVSFIYEELDEKNLPKENDFDIISIFVGSQINENVLDYFNKLKFITTRSTGFEHIDAKAVKKNNVKVSYVPGYGENAVAEFTFGLILSLSRNIYHGIDRIKENGKFDFEGLRGIDIYKKKLGVVGVGRIGKSVIRIAKGFGMDVIASDPYPDKKFGEKLGFEYVKFEELLENSDIITLHAPHNESTHHMINKNNINNIKKGAFLINTARGGLIETEALVKALGDGIIKGAGLDVLEEEGEIKDELNFIKSGHPSEEKLKNIFWDHTLLRMPNVLITPHNAFNSVEALQEILETTVENIESFINGKAINLIPNK